MESDSFLRIVLLVISIILSGFFSGAEVALFSIDKKKIKDFRKDSKVIGSYLQLLLDNPRRILVTILLGNTVVNTAASIISVLIALDLAKVYGVSEELAVTIQILILTIIILLFGEIIPKLVANKNSINFAKVVALPLYWISVLFFPIAKILSDLLRAATSRMKTEKFKNPLLSSEITELTTLGVEKGTIEEDEHELIEGIVSFRSVTAREIMTPRVDIVAVPVDITFDELMKVINESGYSRIPLYENSLDNIIGIIYAKDLLPYLKNPEMRKSLSLRKIAREVFFVPQTKYINELLHDFQEKKLHLGIVVDEYGGTAGLISLEDILEEIVGDIRDEFDKEENPIVKVSENSYLLSGRLPIDELSELLETEFSNEDDDYDTLAGFILNHAGSIPEEGFSFVDMGVKFTVKEIHNKRINKVLVEKLPEQK
ncbi:putative membrane CBS domain protein [Melioribacter roseus P3M-2]|uniref:Putative membrane CBS domain protein n=1 Tax=Melioribacter roseus (strain DSM 23840 / JCM 17771 / VKM B-2668 / P3M-2) TaxID=1191523 RepID=I6Z9H2_MELRP|nr:hemolysin family protein [Melioribacter roseus]AFN75790.1 putative membrane CBS domain protein [Melioribacter roseus P3M-2]